MDFKAEFNKIAVLDFLKNQFLPDDFTISPEPVLTFTPDRIKEIEYIGASEKLDLKLYIIRHESENDPRVALSRETFRVMSHLGARRALVAFHSGASPNWRLSLATIDLTLKGAKTKREYSNPRRYSFYLGPEAKTKTPEQFLTRKGRVGSFEDLKERFSVEVVTKEFFKELSNWYFWAVKSSTFPKDVENEKSGKNIAAIRMVTRLIFIWFMKQKKLVPDYLFNEKDVKDILLDLSSDGDSYYKAILQNLFFATLNTPAGQRKFRAQKEFQGKNKDFMEHSYYRYEKYFKDPEHILSLFKDIPFLNGGLFDCLDECLEESGGNRYIRTDGFSDRADNPLHVPNCLFFSDERTVDLNEEYGTKNVKYPVRGLINILESYNFTIDENTPVDEEIALDPELLGRVFENFLASYNQDTATAARKATGSYYTPREIVSYMVEESLKEFFKAKLAPARDLDVKLNSLLSYNTDINPFSDNDSSELINAINSLKIIDPAVGSGAFPMGILHRLVLVLSKLDPHNEKWERQQIDAVEENVSDVSMKRILIAEIERNFRKNELDYGRKLYLIQNCIYGVDIQPIAIQIAKLRFFISLLVDEKPDDEEKDMGIKPLPNLDFKLVCANSLLGLPELHKPSSDISALSALESEKQELSKEYMRKFNSGKLDIFEKKQIEDRLKNIDKKMAEISQSAGHAADAHSLFSSGDTITGLQEVRAKYFAATNRTEKNKLKEKFFKIQEQIRAETGWSQEGAAMTELFGHGKIELKTETKVTEKAAKLGFWDPFSNKSCDWFDPDWMFGVKDGFDIVIANPPYVRQEEIKEFKPAFKEQYECFTGTADLYVYFYERSLKLLKDNGILTFISSNKYFRAGYGEKLRGFLAEKSTIHQLIDFGDAPVFTAIAYPSIIVLSKSKATGEGKSRVFSWNPAYSIDEFTNRFHAESFLMPQKELKPDSWRLESQSVLKLLEKLRKAGTPLGEYVKGRFYRGILTGLNEAFVVDRVTRDRLIAEHKSSAEILKPFLRGRDVKRWKVNFAEQYLIKIESSENKKHTWSGHPEKEAEKIFAKTYPAIHAHLQKFRDGLINRDDQGNCFWELRSCVYWKEFEQTKIIVPAITSNVEYALDNGGYFSNDKTSICVTEKPNYLLALLNSRVLWWYIRKIAASKQGGFYEFKPMYVSELPIPEDGGTKPLESLVGKILTISRKEDILFLEREIDRLVYKLYNLTQEEIKIVESSIVAK